MSGRGVAVTGLGCVCASAERTGSLVDALRSGESGLSIAGTDSHAWGLGPDAVDFEGRVSRLAIRRLDASMKRALHATLQAVEQAGCDVSEPSTSRGVVVATGYAGTASSHEFIRTVWEHGPEGADPSLFPNTVPNGPAGQLAIRLKARGPGTNFFEADTAGESTLEYARREILAGHADTIVVCGVDERARALIAVEDLYRRARTRRSPEGLLRPFDAGRTGTAMGQAAVAVLLESCESAEARGADVLARLGPARFAAEASPPGAWPSKPGVLAACALGAMEGSGVPARDLAFLCGSARGSVAFDAYEADAIARLGRETGGGLPTCAPMGLTGSLSTSGIFRLVVSVLGLREGFVPATARLREPDRTLGVDVAPEARPARGGSALLLGAGSGGTMASLVVSLP